jgi:alpha-tubulin suppressor-like RCC1 family protein
MRRISLVTVLVAALIAGAAGSASALEATTTSAKSVYQWGAQGSAPGRYSTPTLIAGASGVTQMDAENGFNYALLTNGTVVAWGRNDHGELGDGTTTASASAVAVKGLTNVVQVDGGNQFGLAVKSDGTVWTWGSVHGVQTKPQKVAGLSNVVQVSAGSSHSLALLSNGTVMAWGTNHDGQLGIGSTKAQATPVLIPNLSDVKAVSAGNLSSAALLDNGTVMTWGNNTFGQLGDGSTTNSDVPVALSGLSNVAQISAGGNSSKNGHMLALLTNGTIMAWGDNSSGQLGNDTYTSSSTPVVVGGSDPLSNVKAVSAGGYFSLALRSDGSVSGWGTNSSRELLLVHVKQSDVPVTLAGLNGVQLIGAGAVAGIAATSPAS